MRTLLGCTTVAYIICRWIKPKTGRKIRSKYTTLKAFYVTTNVCLTFKKPIVMKLFCTRLMFVRTHDISLESLLKTKNYQKGKKPITGLIR